MDRIRNQFSFLPPRPPSYMISSTGSELIYTIPDLNAHHVYAAAKKQGKIRKLTTRRGRETYGKSPHHAEGKRNLW